MGVLDLESSSQTVRFVTAANGIDFRNAAPDFLCLVRHGSTCSSEPPGEAIRDVSESRRNRNSEMDQRRWPELYLDWHCRE